MLYFHLVLFGTELTNNEKYYKLLYLELHSDYLVELEQRRAYRLQSYAQCDGQLDLNMYCEIKIRKVKEPSMCGC
jgi:hypothetical protein